MKQKIFSLLVFTLLLLGLLPVSQVFAATDIFTGGYVSLLEEYTASQPHYVIIKKVKTTASGDIVIPSYYNGKPVKEIAKNAFASCNKITSITIPDTVTHIRNSAFDECTGLKFVTFGSGTQIHTIERYAFYGCKSLESINIPGSLQILGDSAFRECTSLKTVNLPSTLQSVEGNMFSSPNVITSFNVGNGSYYYSEDGVFFSKSDSTLMYYPTGNTRTSYTIPDGITAIGNNACWGNPYLETLVFPDSVTKIGSYAFKECSALTNVTLSRNLTSVGNYAFDECNLSSLDIPAGLTTVGNYAFGRSKSLKKIYWNVEDPSGWKSDALYTSFTTAEYDVVFGENVTVVPSGVFSIDTGRIKKLTLNNKITEIPDYAFRYIKVEELVIPDSVQRIGTNAFKSATLGYLTLGSGITEIAYGAFNSAKITEVKYNGTIQDWVNIQIASDNTAMTGKTRRYLYALATFNPDGGICEVETKRYKTGEAYGELPVPKRSGYTFTGWYNNGKKRLETDIVDISGLTKFNDIVADETYTARWSLNTYTFETNGGTSVPAARGEVAVKPNTTNGDLIFLGWYDNPEFSGEPVSFPYGGEKTTLYAKWQKKYNLRLASNGGSFGESYDFMSAISGTAFAIPEVNPKLLGYKFLGWSEDKNATVPTYQTGDSVTLVDSDITLYALWEGVVYTETTILNGIYMVTPYGLNPGVSLMMAGYQGNRLIFFQNFTWQGEAFVPFAPDKECDTVRVFVWDSLSGLTPLTSPGIVR